MNKIYFVLIFIFLLVGTSFIIADENELTEDILNDWKNSDFISDGEYQAALFEGSTQAEKIILWNELSSVEGGFEKQMKLWSLLNNEQKQITWINFLERPEINDLAKVIIGRKDLTIKNLDKIPRNAKGGLSLSSYKQKSGDYFFGITGEHISDIDFEKLKSNPYLKEINYETSLDEELDSESGNLVFVFDPRKENKKEDFRTFKFNSGSIDDNGYYYDERGKKIANILYGNGGEITAKAIYEVRPMKNQDNEDVIISDYKKTVFYLSDENSLLRIVNPDNSNQELYIYGIKNKKSSVDVDYLLNTFSKNSKVRFYENKEGKLLHTVTFSIGNENINIIEKKGYKREYDQYVKVKDIRTYGAEKTIDIEIKGVRDFLTILPQKPVNNLDIKDSINVELYDIQLASRYPSINVDREVVRLNNNQIDTITVDKLRYYDGKMSYIINAVRTGEETGRIAQVLKAANIPVISDDKESYLKNNLKIVNANVEGKIRKVFYEPEPINDYINRIYISKTEKEKVDSWKEFMKSEPNINSHKEDHYYLVGKLRNKDVVGMWTELAYEYDTSKTYAPNEYNINHFWNLLTESNQEKLARIFKEHYNFGSSNPKTFLAESIKAAQEAKKKGNQWELA